MKVYFWSNDKKLTRYMFSEDDKRGKLGVFQMVDGVLRYVPISPMNALLDTLVYILKPKGYASPPNSPEPVGELPHFPRRKRGTPYRPQNVMSDVPMPRQQRRRPEQDEDDSNNSNARRRIGF